MAIEHPSSTQAASTLAPMTNPATANPATANPVTANPATANPATAIEHQNVPVAHQGLHEFLYSSADEHAAEPERAPATLETIDADAILPLEDWCTIAGKAKVAGVYGVFDRDRRLQYVNISRNVSLSLRGHHTQLGPDLCAFVRVAIFSFPRRDEMAALQATWIAAWVADHGNVPIGNLDEEGLWAKTTGEAAIAAMSPPERAAYEEKKLKLRKAMADTTVSSAIPTAPLTAVAEQPTNADRSQHLELALQSDDWSSVIQTQTQETL